MPLDIGRASLYRASINLYVEDVTTATYLAELWRDSTVAFFLGVGNESVHAIAHIEQRAGSRNVFGLIDRDYRPSNRERWLEPAATFPVFILPVHEIENYMLDAAALQASRYHNRSLSTEEIEQHLHNAASRLCWWVACRDAIVVLKQRFREGFIKDPSQSITDETSARRHIRESRWFSKLAEHSARSTEADVDRLIAEAHAQASLRLEDGTWKENFAGKEIFQDLCIRIQQQPTRLNSAIVEDLARGIAGWQVANGSVPPDLTVLLASLKARIARRPPPA